MSTRSIAEAPLSCLTLEQRQLITGLCRYFQQSAAFRLALPLHTGSQRLLGDTGNSPRISSTPVIGKRR